MIKINSNVLKILKMNSLNVKHQGKSSGQLAFHLSAYTHLLKLQRVISQKDKKYKFTVWIIQSLILIIKMTCKRKWMSWLGCTRQCKKDWKQHHIQNQSKFLLQQWLTLFAFVALIKMLCCLLMQWTETWHTKTWSN